MDRLPGERFDTGVRPAEVVPDRPRPFDTPWGSFALHLVSGRVVAAQSFCPHLLGPLFEGTRSGDEITCPWHAWRFSLTSGACTSGPGRDLRERAPLRFCDVELGPSGTLVLRPQGPLAVPNGPLASLE